MAGCSCNIETLLIGNSKPAYIVARVFVWYRSKERPRNGIFDFGRAGNGTRAKKWKMRRGRGKKRFLAFLPHPLPALLLAPFFARSLTLVLCSKTSRKRLLRRLGKITIVHFYLSGIFVYICLITALVSLLVTEKNRNERNPFSLRNPSACNRQLTFWNEKIRGWKLILCCYHSVEPTSAGVDICRIRGFWG